MRQVSRISHESPGRGSPIDLRATAGRVFRLRNSSCIRGAPHQPSQRCANPRARRSRCKHAGSRAEQGVAQVSLPFGLGGQRGMAEMGYEESQPEVLACVVTIRGVRLSLPIRKPGGWLGADRNPRNDTTESELAHGRCAPDILVRDRLNSRRQIGTVSLGFRLASGGPAAR
jgi:hypothetical protein